jgi:glycosyltransferase involved in cell wall biosynthesis
MSNLRSQNVASNDALTSARASSVSTHSSELAPVALFVYNRPEHTRRTVESLRANELARRSDLFVFADGAKNEPTASAVREVRKFIHTIDGFKSVTVIERERNLGLAGSVINGVTQLSSTFGRVIVMEDDLLTTPDFLEFMNRALERYEAETKIISVSGFNFALNVPEQYPYDAFCSYRSSSWGWGTWQDRWQTVDWNVTDYASFHADKGRQQLFNRGGEDLSRMLDLQMAGKIDSWAIRWAYNHFRKGGVALLSTVPIVQNIGLDRSGVHSSPRSARQSELVFGRNSEYRFPHSIELDPCIVAEIQRTCRPSLPTRFARYVLDKLRQNGLTPRKSCLPGNTT